MEQNKTNEKIKQENIQLTIKHDEVNKQYLELKEDKKALDEDYKKALLWIAGTWNFQIHYNRKSDGILFLVD